MEPPSELEVALQQSSSGFGASSLETTIIDYSLSRADLRLADLPHDPEGVVEIASSDLDKRQIFDAVGRDEDEILLRNTYRQYVKSNNSFSREQVLTPVNSMRATLYTGDPAETEKTPDIPGIWAEYVPRTNLVWLLFILKNLLKNRKAEAPQPAAPAQRRVLAPCSPNKKLTEGSNKGKPKAKDHEAAGALVKDRQTKDLSARVSKLKQMLEDRLQSVLGLLDIEHGHEDMCCAADLVAYAMDSQWLAEQDFF
jgi:serine/threonine-protein kinase haspin